MFRDPNPWDVGTARYLQHLGFPALATTSAGFAFSQGLPDSGNEVVVSRDRSLAYIADITEAVELPVNADFMSGYGLTPEDVAESVRRCVATGVAGLSIEDATNERVSPLYELPRAVDRVRAAREAIDQSGGDVLLTARAECYHVGHPDPFRETVRRLQAYAAAGADVLFAPGPQTSEEIAALVEAVAPKPLNLLVVRDIGLGVDEIAALIWDLVALNSTPSLSLHKEPEVAIGTMGIGLDFGGFGLDALQASDIGRIVSAFPRLRMKDKFSETCCRLVTERPETSHDNFLRDFGERFVPGYKAVSTVDLLMNAPFDE